jgi:hypothetical protein
MAMLPRAALALVLGAGALTTGLARPSAARAQTPEERPLEVLPPRGAPSPPAGEEAPDEAPEAAAEAPEPPREAGAGAPGEGPPLEVLPPRGADAEEAATDAEPPPREAAGASEDDDAGAGAREDAQGGDGPEAAADDRGAADDEEAAEDLGRPVVALPPPLPEEETAPEPSLPARELAGSSPRALAGEHLGAWLEAGIAAGGAEGDSAVAFSPEMGLRYRVSDAVVADVTWGLIVARTRVAGEGGAEAMPISYDRKITRVEPGNPVVHGAFSRALGDALRLEVGLGVAVPTASRAQLGADRDALSERQASELAYRAALAMRGYWSPWRWAPERFGLFLPVRVDVPVARSGAGSGEGDGDVTLAVEADLGVGVMLPVLGDRNRDADVIVQGAVGIGGRVVGPLHLGVRLRAVGAASGAVVPDALVTSAEPWVRLRLDPAHLALRGNLTLNGTDGLGRGRGPSFGVFLSGGVEL